MSVQTFMIADNTDTAGLTSFFTALGTVLGVIAEYDSANDCFTLTDADGNPLYKLIRSGYGYCVHRVFLSDKVYLNANAAGAATNSQYMAPGTNSTSFVTDNGGILICNNMNTTSLVLFNKTNDGRIGIMFLQQNTSNLFYITAGAFGDDVSLYDVYQPFSLFNATTGHGYKINQTVLLPIPMKGMQLMTGTSYMADAYLVPFMQNAQGQWQIMTIGGVQYLTNNIVALRV